MILSFSVPAMRPYIVAGLRQRAGEDVGTARVKRQTIRPRGPRNARLLDMAKAAYWTLPYDLHLWWKSRTAERAFLGKVINGQGGGVRLYPIEILHSTIEPVEGPAYPVIRITGPRGWRSGDSFLFWSPGDAPGSAFEREARADGFDSPEAFRDFFVPNVGDRFEGALFKW